MNFHVKEPEESPGYNGCSTFAVEMVSRIVEDAISAGNNRIFIHTNLRRGLPLENINKVAGPFVEAWAVEQFESVVQDGENRFDLVNAEAGARLAPYDVVLQFRRKRGDAGAEYISANVDVKATSEDIANSGKSPNITSFARVRSAYLEDPDYLFLILSLKHRVYGERDPETALTNGIMEVTSGSVYDLKYISEGDLSYNPALGTGQMQIRDIHYVETVQRTTREFLQMLDQKYIRSRGDAEWLRLARKHLWIKERSE